MFSASLQRQLYELSKKLLSPQATLFESDPAQRVEDLQQVLRFHEWKYYVQNDPVVSDLSTTSCINYWKNSKHRIPT